METRGYRLMRALVLHNPLAAGAKGHDKASIIAALQLAGIKSDYLSSKDDDRDSALKRAYDAVIAAGGDGTVNYVFKHLADRSIPIGVLPLGSANNIARSLGIAGTPAELAEQWRAGHVHSFHLVEVAFGKDKMELCTEGFGVGLMAALIKRRARAKKAADGADDIRRGRRAFAALLSEAEPLDLEVTVDGMPWKSGLISVDVLNVPFTGPALPLAHDADPGDTILDVIGFERDRRGELLEWIKNPHAAAPPASTRRGSEVEIRWRDTDCRLDDQVVKGRPDWRRAVVRCDPRPLHVLVPARHPAVKYSADHR